MLLGIVKRRPNEDALLPLEAEAADVCVGDPGHGSGKDTGAGARSQMKMCNRCDQRDARTNFTQLSFVISLVMARLLFAAVALGLSLPGVAGADPRQVKPDRPAIDALLDAFVPAVVEQKDLKAGWNMVAGPARTTSYPEWLKGNTSVQSYPAKGTQFHGFVVNYSYPGDIGFDLLLQPTKRSLGAWSFRAEAQRIGGRWRITTWYPVATFAPPGRTQTVLGPNDLGAANSSTAAGTESRLHSWVLLVPVLFIGGIALVGLAFGLTRWARTRSQIRELQRDLARGR
jgi:hypothetical protein